MGETFVVSNTTAKISPLNKHYKDIYVATQLLQMYKLLSTGTRRFYREYAWKASAAKVSPSEIYPLYGSSQYLLSSRGSGPSTC